MEKVIFLLVSLLGISLGVPVCTDSGTVNIPSPPASQIDHVLYVIVHYPGYNANMHTGFVSLAQGVAVHPGSTATEFYLSTSGPALDITNGGVGYTQVWVADLSQNTRVAQPWQMTDLSPNHMDAYAKIASWYQQYGNKNIICDARWISGLWAVGGRPHRPESNLIDNYYENLRRLGGGLVLLTDHAEFGVGSTHGYQDGFEVGINEINKLIGIDEFVGYFYAPPYTLKVDTSSPLMSYPNFAAHTNVPLGSPNWFVWDDSSTGYAPTNLQPNGLIMYPAGWHSDNSGGVLQPGISTTIRGSVGFLVAISAPLCDESFAVGVGIIVTGHIGTGSDNTGVGPYIYNWSDDVAGAIGNGISNDGSFTAPIITNFAVGDHIITLHVEDAQGLVAEAKVTIHVTAPICLTNGGTYHTQSEGDAGDLCSEGFQTGCYRDANFNKCFPNGLTVGCTSKFTIKLDSSAAVANYLPQIGAPAALDQSYNNPSNPPPISTTSGNFGGQITALALSLGFEACDPKYHTACGSLGELYICDERCAKCKRNNDCKRNKNDCQFVREEEEDNENDYEMDVRNNKNNNNGKPKYANCEKFFGWQVKEIFKAANDLLGGCSSCGSKRKIERNNENCVRNNKCRKSEEARNNKNCSRNKSCKKNKNCCCCADQSNGAPECDVVLLNSCVTLINQAFIFEKTLEDVDGGNLFFEKPCACENGYEWIATVNGNTVPLNPFIVTKDISSYYGYNIGDASSANTPDGLEDTNGQKALIEFVTDGNNQNNFLVIYDTPNDATGGSAISTLTHNGNLDGATFVVQDDVGEGLTKAPGLFKTSHNWSPCCTDGFSIGPIPSFACFTFELGATTGITSLRLASKGAVDGTAIEVPKSDAGSIKIDICNRCKRS